MKKVKVVNKRKFIAFIVICIVIIALVIAGIVSLTKPKDPASCNHKWKDGICKRCGTSSEKLCEHQWDAETGICKTCGYTCLHVQCKQGVCIVCGYNDPDYVADPRESWPASTTDLSSYPVSEVTDDYLILVNKTYKLTKDYVPTDLVAVTDEFRVEGVGSVSEKTNCLRSAAAAAFVKMATDAAEQGINIKMRTGYRSYEYQEYLYNLNYQQEGEDANKSSAKAGESEHQLGLAVDIGGESQDYAMSNNFLSSMEGRWVIKHCAEYGFILRFTDGTTTEVGEYTKYVIEPWHFRYVGVEAATIIMNEYKSDNKFTLEQYFEIIEAYQ